MMNNNPQKNFFRNVRIVCSAAIERLNTYEEEKLWLLRRYEVRTRIRMDGRAHAEARH